MKISIWSTQIIDTHPDLKGYGGLELVIGLLAKYIDKYTDHTLYLFATEDSYVPEKENSYLFSIAKAGKIDEVTALKTYWKDERARNALIESDICLDSGWIYALYHPDVYPKLKNVMKAWHGPDPGFKTPPPVEKPCLTVVGFNLARDFIKETGKEWRTVHNGIDVSKYPFCKEKEDYFLMVGRIYAFKAQHRFINICNKMQHKGIIIGGSFGDTADYVNLIKSECEKSKYVEFRGHVSFEEKVELYQKAKAVVIPNILELPTGNGKTAMFREPFGLITLEANACGTPVVASPIYGWTETLIHGLNGFHANSDDEFIYYLKRIDEIKAENCRMIAEHFRYERMAEEYLKLMKEVIEGRKW